MSDIDHRPDLRLGLALTTVLLGTSLGLIWWATSVRDRLPEPVARHWGMSGAADGFSSLNTTLAVSLGMVLLVAVPMGLAAVLARQPPAMRRFMAGMSAWLAVFLVVLFVDSLRGQLDLTDAADAPLPGAGIGAGMLLGAVVAVGVAALVRVDQGATRAVGPPPATAVRLDPGSEAALSWSSGPAGLDRAAVVIAAFAGVGLGSLAAVLTWWLLPVAIIVVALVLGAGRFTTTIDRDGLTVGIVGRRILRVPLEDVAGADVVHVDPFWEFGGWGLRLDMAGRTGVVTRRGPAVRVRRGDGSEVLVTVDGADRAAATLNTLADSLHNPT